MKKCKMNPVDEFAKSALQSYMIICESFKVNDGFIAETAYKQLAAYSYEIADAMVVEKRKRDTNLCDNCKLHPATCKSDPVFGLGIGCDNVVNCHKYSKKDGHKIRTFFRRTYFKIRNKLTQIINKQP